VVALLAGAAAVIAVVLLRNGSPVKDGPPEKPLVAGPAGQQEKDGGAANQAPPPQVGIAIGKIGRPTAGDALLKDGQYPLVEPRPAVQDKNILDSVSFSPDGALLATPGPGNQVTLRDAATGAQKAALSIPREGRIERAVFTADGCFLAATQVYPPVIHVWELQTGKVRRTLEFGEDPIEDFAISPDGGRVVTIDRRGKAKVWDASTGGLQRELPEKTEVFRHVLALSPDGKLLAVPQKDGKGVTVYDVATGAVRHRLSDGKGEVYAFTFSPDGKALAVSGERPASRLVLFDLDSGKPRWTVPVESGWFTKLAFSPSGRTLAAGRDNGGGMELYEAATGKHWLHVSGVRMTVQALAFSPDGSSLAATDNYEPRVHWWHILPSEQERTVITAAPVRRVSAGRSGKLLLAATRKGVEVHDTAAKKARTFGADRAWDDATLMPDETSVLARGFGGSVVFDLATGAEKPAPDGQPDGLLVYAPDGKAVAAGSDGVTVHRGAEELRRMACPRARSLALSADGKVVAVGDERGKVRLWEVETGKPRGVLDAHEGLIQALALSPDGQRLASGGSNPADHTVRLWEVATGKEVATLTGHVDGVTGLLFSPDGKYLVSGGRDARLLVWDARTGRPLRRLWAHVRQVSQIDPLGADRFVTVEADPFDTAGQGPGRILFWDWAKATTPDPQFRLPAPPASPPAAFLTRVKSLGPSPEFAFRSTFSPDGRWLAWVADRVIHVRDLKSLKDVFALKGHAETPGALLFTGDGEHLVSGGKKTIRWWDLRTGKEEKQWPITKEGLRDLAWADGGKTLISVTFFFTDREVLFWDVASGKPSRKLDEDICPPNPERVVVSPDGRLVAVAGNHIVLLNARTQAVVHMLKPESTGRAIAFSPDGKRLAMGARKVSSDAPVSVFDVESGRLLHTLPGYVDEVWGVTFPRGGQDLLAFGRLAKGTESLRLWDVQTGTEKLRIPWPRSTYFLPDGKRLVASGRKEGLWVWNFEDVYDAPLQAALAPLVPLEADGELRDGTLWITLDVQGRSSRKALEQLGKVPRTLGLKLAGVEDADLARLAAAQNVKGLDLSQCLGLRDAALQHIQRMTWLESLTLPRFGFSEEAVQGLKKALPKTKVRTAD
jgi:WD40 repeat protein